MRLSVALGCMQAVKKGGANADLAALGMTAAEIELLTSDNVWMGTDRQTVMRCLESTIFGTADVLGLPRIEISAEFLAAHIYMYVSPVNYMAACSWSGRTASVDKSSSREFDPVTASELHAYLVRLCDADGVEEFRHQFEKQVAAKIKKAVEV